MKKIFLSALLCGSILTYSQNKKNEYVYLERKNKSSHTFRASINKKPITIHLEYVDLAGNMMGVYQYFVKGWYYYNHLKKPIKIIGFYQYGDYTLYHFKQEKNKVNYEKEKYLPLEKHDSLALKNHVKEIIKFYYNEYSDKPYTYLKGNFYGYKKILPAKMYTNDGNIFYDYELIKLPNGKIYNTKNIIPDYAGNKLISCFTEKKENRIILEFYHLSNPTGIGPCYADEDRGYRMLTFDKNWKFKKVDSYELYRCQPLLEIKELKTTTKKIKRYYIEDMGEEKYYLTIDLEKSLITKTLK